MSPCHTSSTASTSSPNASASACLASRALIPTRSAPVASLSKAKRPDASRWSSIAASTFGASSCSPPRSRSTASRDADGRVVDLRLTVGAVGHSSETVSADVADIVAAHPEQHRVDALLDQAADRGRLDLRDVEPAGQRGERDAAVGIRRFLEIVADQLELGVARARVDEVVEQLGESAHRASQCANGVAVPSALVEAHRERGEDRVACRCSIGCRAPRRYARGSMHGDAVAGQQRQLRRAAGEAFQGDHAVLGGHLRGSRPSGRGCRAATGAAARSLDLGDAQRRSGSDERERITAIGRPPCHAAEVQQRG